MTIQLPREHLGEPALEVAGLGLWIHGWEFPQGEDDWLIVTAHCGAPGASVWVRGAIIEATDIEILRDECKALMRGTATVARLPTVEPYLSVEIGASDQLGHLRIEVEITPNNVTQSHTMEFEIDQSYLADIVRQCSAILQQYPVRARRS